MSSIRDRMAQLAAAQKREHRCDEELLTEAHVPFLSGNQPNVMYTVSTSFERFGTRTNLYLCFDRNLTLLGYNYLGTRVTYHPDARAADSSILGIKKLKLNFG